MVHNSFLRSINLLLKQYTLYCVNFFQTYYVLIFLSHRLGLITKFHGKVSRP